MKNFYICPTSGTSGIAHYSANFYDLILKPKGYLLIDSNESITEIFTQISSRDHIHIEIGIFQKKEIEILFLMLQANYSNVAVTLHDAPLLKYPLVDFENPLLNKASKFYDRFIRGFKNTTPLIKKIKLIYVLTRKGLLASSKLYQSGNFRFLPHIIKSSDKYRYPENTPENRNFIYLGFIGKNKGIEYSLKLHAEIVKKFPEVQFYIIGTAIGNEKLYYEYLRNKYRKNVHFLGYVQESELEHVYHKARFALILFRDYRFFYPASGSILNSMNKGKIILTNAKNAIPEIVREGENGFFLTGNLRSDTNKIFDLFGNEPILKKMNKNISEYLINAHGADYVSNHLSRNEVNLPILTSS